MSDDDDDDHERKEKVRKRREKSDDDKIFVTLQQKGSLEINTGVIMLKIELRCWSLITFDE